NKGLERYLAEDLPQLATLPAPLITNVMGSTGDELAALVAACDERPEIAAIEMNVSCRNVKTGLDIGADPAQLEDVVRACRGRDAGRRRNRELSGSVGRIEDRRSACTGVLNDSRKPRADESSSPVLAISGSFLQPGWSAEIACKNASGPSSRLDASAPQPEV